MKALIRKLRSASRLSPGDWLLFFQAWVWLLLFDVGLRVFPFAELQAFARRSAFRLPLPRQQTDVLLRPLIMAVDRARNHHLYRMTCLRRALVLQKMLAQRGIAAELKIGVRKDGGQLGAHAWLEYQGEALGEPERITEKFTPLQKSDAVNTRKDQ